MNKAEVPCKRCKSAFKPYGPKHVFCCNDCWRIFTYGERKEREKIACRCCEKMFVPSHPKTVTCSDKCWIEWNTSKSPKRRSYFRILERDFFRCIYCGKSSIENGAKLCLDHVIPCARGGLHIAGNLVTACRECNQHKYERRIKREVIARIQTLISARNAEMKIADTSPVDMAGYDRYQEPTDEDKEFYS